MAHAVRPKVAMGAGCCPLDPTHRWEVLGSYRGGVGDVKVGLAPGYGADFVYIYLYAHIHSH